MVLVGRLHPLLIHFPIALVIVAVAAEGVASLSDDDRWHTVAVGNVRAGAAFAVLAVLAGWRLAASPVVDPTPLLEWHRWVGTLAACMTFVSALAASQTNKRPQVELWRYRIALAGAGVLVALAGHLGAMLVWGANFLRP